MEETCLQVLFIGNLISFLKINEVLFCLCVVEFSFGFEFVRFLTHFSESGAQKNEACRDIFCSLLEVIVFH